MMRTQTLHDHTVQSEWQTAECMHVREEYQISMSRGPPLLVS